MRLNKFLAAAGITSRRGADELIKSGAVKVNGKVVRELGIKVDIDNDKVEYGGRDIKLGSKVVTYLLNKPRSVVTTATDPEGRKTVMDFLPRLPRVFPCGRLDEDTQGLVILTNDGNLCYQLTHPKFEHEKEYIVHGHAKDPAAALEKLTRGVVLKDGLARPDKVENVNIHHKKLEFTIIIHEGRNRMVRRMCSAVDIEIDSLTRVRVGKYQLGALLPGEYKRL